MLDAVLLAISTILAIPDLPEPVGFNMPDIVLDASSEPFPHMVEIAPVTPFVKEAAAFAVYPISVLAVLSAESRIPCAALVADYVMVYATLFAAWTV